MKIGNIFLRLVVVLVFIFSSIAVAPVHADEPAQTPAQAMLQNMTAEEKIGQLFLVTFNGTSLQEDTPIYDLITGYHIGGVILLAENNNFSFEDTALQTKALTESLQRIEWESSANEIDIEDTGNTTAPAYVPLLIGTRQLGNGFPGDQILRGLTRLPSQMAIGASWDLDLAYQSGEVLGSELNELGINLYLGPNLDVLENANSEYSSSLGVNTYGGDPFWVGEMGKSFISGVHIGSDNRMLVVAQNFPGTGNSDRSPEFEVATVRKSLEQLKQIELAPYFTVTEPEVGDPGRVEAVMVSHIRYQGFQGNIRATTRPISFDSNAFQQIMSLPEFASWREDGGLIISDNLGSGALRRFFDPNETNFDALQVARNAFLAGNDMLYVDDLVSTGDPDAYTTLLSILDFFVQKYREDSAFAQRVDSSVLRILAAKTALFGDFVFDNVIQSEGNLGALGESQDVTFDVARNAVTLISPTVQEVDAILPSPPLWHDNIVIFTDVRTIFPCAACSPTTNVNTNALSSALVNLYGSQAGGQILQQNIASYTFTQLVEVMDNIENDTSEFLASNLRTADWVIFNALDIDPDYPASNALQRILAERPDLLRGKNVIVFAMGSPTYLDATNISKVSAYYALYSKVSAFLDVAARVLMKELDPPGALPVSVPAVGYDLISMTAPDPNQIIDLELVVPEPETVEEPVGDLPEITQTPEPAALPSYNVGDTITIRTGRIYDHNQNTVPDGTIVRFHFQISGEPGITQQFETTTSAGIAYFNYRIESAGGLEIRATSEPATQSETLQINISPDGLTSVLAISPTPQILPTPTVMPSATQTQMPTPTSTPEPIVNSYPTLGEWAMGVIVMGIGGAGAFLIGLLWWGDTRWGLRSFLCAIIGGLLTYSYLNLGIEGTKYWMEKSGTTFVIEMVVVGMLLGWIVALAWWMRTEGRYPARKRQ